MQEYDISPSTLFNPRFFYWDPLILVEYIKCPNINHGAPCSGHLIRHSHATRPRRIVDLEDVFWLIGPRYRCSACSPTATFQSWNLGVLRNLPEPLATEFPAHLSHRSGVSNGVFSMMQRCFQNGMGAKQFSDSLNTLHCRRYEMLEVQYLQTIIASFQKTSIQRTYDKGT